jgi:hypothetical protein
MTTHCHPLNYTEACQPDLRRLAEKLAERMPLSAKAVALVASTLRSAQHFVLPDGGRLFDDGLRGLRGRAVRLPYPEITVEYFTEQVGTGDGSRSTKRIALAIECQYSTFDAVADSMQTGVRIPRHAGDNTAISVSAIDWYDDRMLWFVQPLSLIIGETWEPSSPSRPIEPLFESKKPRSERPVIAFQPVFLLPEIAELSLNALGHDESLRHLVHDVTDEADAVLELCEALTCVNVHVERLQAVSEAVNRKRLACGKTRLPDAWCLTIDVPGEIHEGTRKGGTHASPRTHLRRGHIRRLASGCNVWVNSHVVGAGGPEVRKHYHVRTRR